MFSTEFRYKLNNLRRILKKATVQLIRIYLSSLQWQRSY